MPRDGVHEGTKPWSSLLCQFATNLTIITEQSSQHDAQSGSHDERPGMANAVSRIAQEAKQALSFGSRGVRDITKEFTTASNQLEAGQLVKDKFFTLFEAVGALEVRV